MKGLGYLHSISGEKGIGRGSLSIPEGRVIGGTFMASVSDWYCSAILAGKGKPERRKLVRLAALMMFKMVFSSLRCSQCLI